MFWVFPWLLFMLVWCLELITRGDLHTQMCMQIFGAFMSYELHLWIWFMNHTSVHMKACSEAAIVPNRNINVYVSKYISELIFHEITKLWNIRCHVTTCFSRLNAFYFSMHSIPHNSKQPIIFQYANADRATVLYWRKVTNPMSFIYPTTSQSLNMFKTQLHNSILLWRWEGWCWVTARVTTCWCVSVQKEKETLALINNSAAVRRGAQRLSHSRHGNGDGPPFLTRLFSLRVTARVFEELRVFLHGVVAKA